MRLLNYCDLTKLLTFAAINFYLVDIASAQHGVASALPDGPYGGQSSGNNSYQSTRNQAIINNLNQNLNAINQEQNSMNNAIQSFGNSLQQQLQQDAQDQQEQLQQEQQDRAAQRAQDRLDRLQQQQAQQEQQQQVVPQTSDTGVAAPMVYGSGGVVSGYNDNGGVTTPLIFQNGQVISTGPDNGGVLPTIQYGAQTESTPAFAPPEPTPPLPSQSLAALMPDHNSDLLRQSGSQAEDSIFGPPPANGRLETPVLDPANETDVPDLTVKQNDDASPDDPQNVRPVWEFPPRALMNDISESLSDLGDQAIDSLKSDPTTKYIATLAAQYASGQPVTPIATALRQGSGVSWDDYTPWAVNQTDGTQ